MRLFPNRRKGWSQGKWEGEGMKFQVNVSLPAAAHSNHFATYKNYPFCIRTVVEKSVELATMFREYLQS